MGLVCVLFAAAGSIAGSWYWGSPTIRIAVNTWLTTNPFNPLAAYDPEQQFPQKSEVTVVLLGCDVDYENARPIIIQSSCGRSDALLVAHVDFKNNTINVLSIPRDTAVRIPGHGVNKINAANAFGGPELTKQTIQDVFGIVPDYYVSLNFVGFQKVVDALGGVDLTVDKKLDYDDNWANLHVHLKPGFQHLNGYHAMGFVRIRHSDSDLARADRQHVFLEALREKVCDLSNFKRLPGVVNALADSIHSDMTQDQMLSLANFARKLHKEDVALATLPSIEGPSYVYVNVPKAELVLRKMFFNDTMVAVDLNVPDRGEVPGRRIVPDGVPTRIRRRHRRHSSDHASPATQPTLSDPVLVSPDGSDSGSGSGGPDSGNTEGSTGAKSGTDTAPAAGGTGGAGDSHDSTGTDSPTSPPKTTPNL